MIYSNVQHKTASFSEGSFNYVEANSNSKKQQTILLIHGISANWRDWGTSILSEICLLGYRTIAIDRPGMGDSDRETNVISLEHQSSLIIKNIRTFDSKPLIVIGHSYGGCLALKMALTQKKEIDGLILLATPTHPWLGGLGLLYDTLSLPFFTGIGTKIISILKPKILIDTTLRDVFYPQEMSLNYKDLKVPVEIIHGTKDKIVPFDIHAKPLSEKVNSSKLTPLKGIGHMPHHFRKNVIIQSIISLLAKV